MDLIQKCKKFIIQHNLCTPDKDKVLICLSGGKDSMCLVDILYKLGYKIGLAHVNHQLRGVQADQDESFVQKHAKNLELECFTARIDINKLAKKSKQNLQELARNERYAFFQKIAQKNGYTKIATAHNLDDQIETFFFNFSRGSGLRGMAGIPSKRDNIT